MNKVAVYKCNDYNASTVMQAVTRAVDTSGGIAKFVKPGQRVYLKPNLAGPFPPDKAVTTHPAVVEAVVRLVQSVGGVPVIIDSPAGVHTGPYLKTVYSISGMEQVAKNTGAELCYDTDIIDVKYPEGKVMKNFTLTKPLAQAEVIINIPKLKTHMFTTFTGAIKNFYGSVPGVMKVAYHSKFPEVQIFAQLLLDLYNYHKPRIVLTVVDGITAMDGNGPSWGKPKHVGIIAAGTNGFAVDHVLCGIVGINTALVPTLELMDYEIPVVEGDKVTGMTAEEFIPPESNTVTDGLIALKFIPPSLRKTFGHYLLPKPVVDKYKCRGCRVCADSCPQKTIVMRNKKARVIDSGCIRCWCCNEVCPHGAVTLKQSFLGKMLTKI
ncbi:MAG: DUF362 domain-containing protein [Elusimicrobiota bacterium]